MSDRSIIKDPQGFTLGLLFMALAAGVFWFGSSLRAGSALEMGPGYFPRLLGGGLFVVGLAVSGLALKIEGPAIEYRAGLRPLVVLSAAVFAFGFALESLGLIVATALLIGVSAFASSETKWLETAALAIGVGGLCAVLFVVLLGTPIPIWPTIFN